MLNEQIDSRPIFHMFKAVMFNIGLAYNFNFIEKIYVQCRLYVQFILISGYKK